MKARSALIKMRKAAYPLVVFLFASAAILVRPAFSQLAVGQGSGLAAAGGGGSQATASPAATPTPLFQQQLNDGANFQLRMNDAASPCTTIADTGGGSHNATVHGTITCGVAGGGVDGATAITFDGTTAFLSASPATLAYPFTIEFAIKYSTINTGGIWEMNPGVGGTRDNSCGVGTVTGSSNAVLGVGTGGGSNLCLTSVSAGAWILFDVEYASSGTTVYMNGMLASTSAASSGTYAQGASVDIGALNGNTQFFAGSMQDYAYYPTALSQAKCQKHTAAYLGS